MMLTTPSSLALRAGERRDSWVSLDIIIPMYNEQDVLDLLFKRLDAVFSKANQTTHRLRGVRYVLVDDGSRDRSAEMVARHIENGSPAVLYRLSRNFGHQNAVSAGLQHADADMAAVIDADLQDPPEVILQMVAKWREGFDVVYGERRKRKEGVVKRSSYWLFYRILSFLAEIDIPQDSGDFALIDRTVLHAMRTLPETLRFPRVLRAWVGFRQVGLTYERFARAAGTPKYSFHALYNLATNGVTSASTRPLQLAQLFSVFYLLLVSVLVAVTVTQLWSYRATNPIVFWSVLGYVLIALGSLVQMLCIYILSAYVGRTYLEVKGRPSYFVMEVIGDRRAVAAPPTEAAGGERL